MAIDRREMMLGMAAAATASSTSFATHTADFLFHPNNEGRIPALLDGSIFWIGNDGGLWSMDGTEIKRIAS